MEIGYFSLDKLGRGKNPFEIYEHRETYRSYELIQFKGESVIKIKLGDSIWDWAQSWDEARAKIDSSLG